MVRCASLSSVVVILAVLLSVVTHETSLAQQQFPYVAYVVHNDAYVRSGPGQRYYPTGQLAQGYAVEVYRHDSDGWCAVRPPQNSFSWVAAHEVRLVENNQAEVIAEKTVTRVGSTLSPARSAVQVLLQRGERIAVVPRKPTDDQNWLRVQPPAGEFRWIAASDLGRQAPLEVSPQKPTSGKWSRVKLPGQTAPQQVATLQTSQNTAGSPFGHLTQTESAPVSPTQFQPAPVATVDNGHVDIVAGSPAEMQLAQFQGQMPPGGSQAGHAQPVTGPLANPNAFAAQAPASSSSNNATNLPRVRFGNVQNVENKQMPLEDRERIVELQLRLSQIVSQQPATWQFDQIAAEANGILQETDSASARAELRDLLDRIARFRRIRAGHLQVASVTTPESVAASLAAGATTASAETPAEEFPVPELGEPVSPMADLVRDVRDRVREDFVAGEESGVDESQYDAIGTLKPVVSQRRNAPQYALVNQRGDVISFITPSPDLNLKPYVGRRVGVNGTKGFMNEYRTAHVTAGRITQVEGTIRR